MKRASILKRNHHLFSSVADVLFKVMLIVSLLLGALVMVAQYLRYTAGLPNL